MNLLKSSILNFSGSLVPALAALFTVPIIVSNLGAVNYGVFSLITSIVGYFALVDINMTAGSVKFVAEYQAKGEEDKLSQTVSLGGLIYFAIGIIGGAALWIFSNQLIREIFNVPKELESTAISALRFAAVAFFFSQFQIYLQSVIQALRRYDVSAPLEAGFGTLASLLTVVVVLIGGDLVAIVAARLMVSILNVFVQIYLIKKLLPNFSWSLPSRKVFSDMAKFSYYSYLSKLAAISSANSDKLLIGAVVDMKALAFYSVPFMLANRVFGLIYRLGQVIFPFASALNATRDFVELEMIYLTACRYICFLNISICIVLVAFSPEFLHFWAGSVFGSDAVFVLVFVSFAVFIDSLTNIPSLVNDGMGRPKITGISAVLRSIISIGAVYFGLKSWGIYGAATAQLIVAIFATASFLVAVHRLTIRTSFSMVVRQAYLCNLPLVAVALCLGPLSIQRQHLTLLQFLSGLICIGVALIIYAWFVVLKTEHKKTIKLRLKLMVTSAIEK